MPRPAPKSGKPLDVRALRSWEVIRHSIEASGKSVEQVAMAMRAPQIRLRVTPIMVEGWMREPKALKDADFLHRASQIVRGTGCLLPLQWACDQLGGFFVFGPRAFDKGSSLLPNWYQVTKEFHELRAAIVDAYDDDHAFSREETQRVGRAWVDVLSWTEGFVCWCEGAHLARPAALGSFLTGSLPFLESRDAVREAYVTRNSCGTKGLVEHLGLSVSMLQKWGEDPGTTALPNSGAANPFDYVVQFSRATQSVLPMHWLCYTCDGFLAKEDPCRTCDEQTIESNWQRVHCELAELDFVITAAVQDGKIDHAESPRIRAEWEDVKKWMHGFVQGCYATAK